MNDRRIAPQSIDVGAGEYLTPAQIILMFGFLAYEAPRVPTVERFPRVDSLIPALAPSCNGGRIDDADRSIQSSEVRHG